MRKFLLTVAIAGGLALACPTHATACHKPVKANHTHHTIKVAARPFKALGAHAKAMTVQGFLFSISAFDTAVIDPLGVALQAFADGVDMFVAAPLESLPEPFEAIGDGVHYVYLGIDKAGQVLAR